MTSLFATLRWIRANLKILFWVLLAIIGAVLFGWLELRKKQVTPTKPDSPAPAPPGGFQDYARQQIQDAQTEAHVEAEIAKAKGDEERAKLETIKAMPDAVERRKKLADYLDQNL